MSSITLQSENYYKSAQSSLASQFPDVNTFALANLDKISINVGVGKMEAKDKAEVSAYLEKLTGQKAKQIPSKVSVAGFKLRKGDIVGLSCTLRGKKMYDFLLYLVYIALPRTRDFKGINSNSFDATGRSYSLGIESSSIFPAVGFDATVNFGLQINIVFKTSSDQNRQLLTNLHFPFKK